MHIDVIANIGEARSDEFLHKTVIVIDALRATSTMVTALANGAAGVVPVETVLQAKEQHKPGDLLGGERNCRKIPGFDLGNSPSEYAPSVVSGRRVILTTTNGTRGIQKAAKAEHILAGAFVNGSACAQAAASFKRDIVILCAGTQDVFSLEDGLCAGMLVNELIGVYGKQQVGMNDFGIAMHSGFLHSEAALLDVLLQCANGKKLCKMGLREDVEYCASMNATPVVPLFQQNQMVAYCS